MTTHYFLVTEIFCNNAGNLNSGIRSCKVTNVDRRKLIAYLDGLGLNESKINAIEKEIRDGGQYGKQERSELSWSVGTFFFSTQKAEKPINLVLRLRNLVQAGVATVLFQGSYR